MIQNWPKNSEKMHVHLQNKWIKVHWYDAYVNIYQFSWSGVTGRTKMKMFRWTIDCIWYLKCGCWKDKSYSLNVERGLRQRWTNCFGSGNIGRARNAFRRILKETSDIRKEQTGQYVGFEEIAHFLKKYACVKLHKNFYL